MKKENKSKYINREEKLLDLEYEIIQKMITTRKEMHLTQQQLADEADVIRTTIARIENLMTSPQLNTLIRILEPMGYTLKIEKIEKNKTTEIV